MNIISKEDPRIYSTDDCCIFRKTKEVFGGLSNMASGFPLNVNNIHVLTSEALYQACRFPHLPDIQRKIILAKSPMSAKMFAKSFKEHSRDDWDAVKIKVMRWCLKIKLAQNFITFGRLLESTYNKPIVEESHKDKFWGAIRNRNNNTLIGMNILGRLLMELRQLYNEERYSYELFYILPLNISDFKLYGEFINVIDERQNFISKIKYLTYFSGAEETIDGSLEHIKSIVKNRYDPEQLNLA